MAGGQVLADEGINPLFGMLIYQGRIGYKNWDNIMNALNKNKVDDSIKATNKTNVIAFPKMNNKPWYDFFSDKWNFDFRNIFNRFKNTDNVDMAKQSSKVDNLVSLESARKLKNQDVLIKNGFDNQQTYYMQMASGQGTQGPTMMDGTGSIISNVEGGTGRVVSSGVDEPSVTKGGGKAEIKLGKTNLDALRKKWNVPERNTIAVGKTDIAGLDDITFEGGSPAVRKEAGFENYDISNPNRAIKSSGKIPSATRHAEEVVANEFVEAVEKAGIKSEDVVGTLKIHQSNTSGVCPTCLSGLGNPNKASGVIKQLSLKYPNLVIEVTSETAEGAKVNGRLAFKVKNGSYID